MKSTDHTPETVYAEARDRHFYTPGESLSDCWQCEEHAPYVARLLNARIPAVLEPETGGHTHAIAVYFANGAWCYCFGAIDFYDADGEFDGSEHFAPELGIEAVVARLRELASQNGGFRLFEAMNPQGEFWGITDPTVSECGRFPVDASYWRIPLFDQEWIKRTGSRRAFPMLNPVQSRSSLQTEGGAE